MYRGKNTVHTHTHTQGLVLSVVSHIHWGSWDAPPQIKVTITQSPAFQKDIFLTISLSHLVYFRNEKIILSVSNGQSVLSFIYCHKHNS